MPTNSSTENHDADASAPVLQAAASSAALYPTFDRPVPANGYRWWYVDGISDDGKHAITLIAFVGSVFSPWYAWARKRGDTRAEAHCALNVAIYSPGQGRWTMTERHESSVERSAQRFRLGPSDIRWDGGTLVFDICERTAPFMQRVRGQVRVHAGHLFDREYALSDNGRHWWHPVAPASRIEVAFEQPGLRWQGHAYMDSNRGDEPLERGFHDWYWQRAVAPESTSVAYVTRPIEGRRIGLGLMFANDGQCQTTPLPPETVLKPSGWRVAQTASADAQTPCRHVRWLEDTPFYSRSEIALQFNGRQGRAIHESLSLKRFASPVVQMLLPFRAPRAVAFATRHTKTD